METKRDYIIFIHEQKTNKQTNRFGTFRNISNWRIRLSQSVFKLTVKRKWKKYWFLSRSRVLILSPWGCFLSYFLVLARVENALESVWLHGESCVRWVINALARLRTEAWSATRVRASRQKPRGEVTETPHRTVTMAAGWRIQNRERKHKTKEKQNTRRARKVKTELHGAVNQRKTLNQKNSDRSSCCAERIMIHSKKTADGNYSTMRRTGNDTDWSRPNDSWAPQYK